ncbi:MAG: hypothetical protein SFX73_12390 [Kofleriaceae bacterium]|nr:hypothetical protein [Kofleriaceae bacterium]
MRALACVMLVAAVAHADVPVATERDAIATTIATLAKPDAQAAPGAATKIAWIERIADAKATAKNWRAAIAAAKLKIIWEEVGEGSVSFVVESSTKARATIAAEIWSSSGSIWVTAKPILGAKMPGTCVPVPQVTHQIRVRSQGVDHRGEHSRRTSDQVMATASIVDLDGDAIPDRFVPAPASKNDCREETPYRAFIMRGTCGHEVGVVGPGWWAPDVLATPPDASGLRPLTFVAEHGQFASKTAAPFKDPPMLVRTTRTFAATKGSYVKTSENTTSGVCHHCAVWTCSAP